MAAAQAKKKPLQILQNLQTDPHYFVTFTQIEKVGINPKNAFSTPIGVYAYPLKHLYKDWESGDDFFGKDRKFANLLRLKTDKILEIETYQLNPKDLDILKKHYHGDIPFETLLETFQNPDPNSIYHSKNDGDILWKLSEAVALSQTSDNPKAFTVKWNKILREMGYDAVLDNQSTIHPLQSSQIVFLSPDAYETIDRLPNKMKTQDLVPKPASPKNHFWHPGPNPTVDMVVIHKNKVLLIQRGPKSQVEAGKWALPGGFIDTTAKKGEAWKAGRETPKKAALRELTEETNLYLPNISNIAQRLHEVGVFEGNQRDPRDSDHAWSQSHAFTIEIKPKDNLNLNAVQGQDDAIHAKWFPLNEVPPLAFDHQKILEKALQVLKEKERKPHEILATPT